ncbi:MULTISPECIES: glycosyltransferase family 4 protein [unclassified Methanoculleus]|jgi:glycosyltransferase involved in cell wall biosynthesis|uniref:glycosyltransferase family 4 protein n=1 Tax=unclassified Methanoculleus TaxID=2619537 RepID=UPI00319E9012
MNRDSYQPLKSIDTNFDKLNLMRNRSLNIGIITPPIGAAGVVPLSNLVNVISYISDFVFVITGKVDISPSRETNSNIFIYRIPYTPKSNIIQKITGNFLLQVHISNKIIKLKDNVDVLLYFLDSHVYILPALIGKLLKKKIVFVLAASISNSALANANIFSKILRFSESINFKYANCIVVYSPSLLEKWGLQNYAHKIRIAHEHSLDFNSFCITTPLSDRPSRIGYIGRLSGEKGVQHFVQALPAILSDRKDLRVLIGGDGQLKETIETSLKEEGASARVDLPGWIPHDDLPRYLNQLRLLVLPSYSEGLPNVMLEAMACGTPVLATPVGAIPDIIIDGKTGFIIENNSPECIAKNVIRALCSPDLEQIAGNGRRFVEEHFTFEKTVEDWKRILQDIE